jgi:hypothetical protein
MNDDDPGSAFLSKALQNKGTDWTARLLRIMLLMSAAFIACIFSILCVLSCSFITYTVPPGFISTSTAESHPFYWDENAGEDDPVTFASLGLYRFNPNGIGCQDYTFDDSDAPRGVWSARLGGVGAFNLGTLGCLLLLLECMGCRFWCNRVTAAFTFLGAFILQCFTFMMFTTDGKCLL